MKKINLITKYAFLMIASVLIFTVANASAQTKKIDTLEKRFDDFEVKAEMWGDVIKDSNGTEQGFKNCRIKVKVKNTSGEAIMKWIFEARMNRDPKGSGSYDDKKLERGYISGSPQEIVFDGYCYMKSDSLKVYKKP
jgi:hypothetical protein